MSATVVTVSSTKQHDQDLDLVSGLRDYHSNISVGYFSFISLHWITAVLRTHGPETVRELQHRLLVSP
jgi:hypothetical protein